MAEEERQRRMDEERAERLREEEERRRQEEEDRLRRERMLSNIDRSKEDEVDEYFRNAKEKEEEARRKRVLDKKKGPRPLRQGWTAPVTPAANRPASTPR